MITYKLGQTDLITNTPKCIVRSDGVSIPFAPDNTDYATYLQWISEGNEPLPADEVTE